MCPVLFNVSQNECLACIQGILDIGRNSIDCQNLANYIKWNYEDGTFFVEKMRLALNVYYDELQYTSIKVSCVKKYFNSLKFNLFFLNKGISKNRVN